MLLASDTEFGDGSRAVRAKSRSTRKVTATRSRHRHQPRIRGLAMRDGRDDE